MTKNSGLWEYIVRFHRHPALEGEFKAHLFLCLLTKCNVRMKVRERTTNWEAAPCVLFRTRVEKNCSIWDGWSKMWLVKKKNASRTEIVPPECTLLFKEGPDASPITSDSACSSPWTCDVPCYRLDCRHRRPAWVADLRRRRWTLSKTESWDKRALLKPRLCSGWHWDHHVHCAK